jgi:hypothetical protein
MNPSQVVMENDGELSRSKRDSWTERRITKIQVLIIFFTSKGTTINITTPQGYIFAVCLGECEAGGPVSPHPCEDVDETEAGRLCDLLLNSPGLASCRSLLSPRPFHEACRWSICHTANEGLVRIQYKCLVPIYVFLERKQLFPKQS